jgi:cell division septal protein FtsQ
VVRRRYLAFQGRSLWIRARQCLIGFVGVVLVAGSLWAGRRVWETAPFLKVRGIEFEPPASVINEEDLSFQAGDHLFGFSAGALREALLAKYPQLLNVRLSRSWDGVVTVHWLPRAPLGMAAQGSGWLAVDSAGSFFPVPANSRLPELDADVAHDPAVLVFLERLRQIHPRWLGDLARVHRTPAGLVQFQLKGGTEILWGEAGAGSAGLKAKRLDRILFDPGLSHKGFQYAHFIDDGRIVVKKRR